MNITGNITMENKASYRTISLEGMWKDNLGQIGLFEAYGKVDKLSTEPNIEAVGYGRSEFNEEFWFIDWPHVEEDHHLAEMILRSHRARRTGGAAEHADCLSREWMVGWA